MSGPIGAIILFGDPLAHEVMTATGATSLTATTYQAAAGGEPAKTALVSVEAFTARMRVDGTAVTATTGHEIPAGGSYVIQGITAIKQASFIDTASGASTIRVTTFR